MAKSSGSMVRAPKASAKVVRGKKPSTASRAPRTVKSGTRPQNLSIGAMGGLYSMSNTNC
jgi:hypothetical protein